jgi:hypothetical protein
VRGHLELGACERRERGEDSDSDDQDQSSGAWTLIVRIGSSYFRAFAR